MKIALSHCVDNNYIVGYNIVTIDDLKGDRNVRGNLTHQRGL